MTARKVVVKKKVRLFTRILARLTGRQLITPAIYGNSLTYRTMGTYRPDRKKLFVF